MNILLALCAFMLSLAGIDFGSGQYTHQLRRGDTEILYSRAEVQAGVGHFECVRSSTGRCHYTVYPRACEAAAACGLGPLRRFVLDAGETRQLAGLAHVQLCVATGGEASPQACQAGAATPAASVNEGLATR